MWIKTTKNAPNQEIEPNPFWAIFLGIFEIGQKGRKILVEKKNTSLIRGQPKALVPYGAGWVPIFHGIDEERKEREEH